MGTDNNNSLENKRISEQIRILEAKQTIADKILKKFHELEYMIASNSRAFERNSDYEDVLSRLQKVKRIFILRKKGGIL